MIPGYKIRDLAIEPGLVLAPMSGVTTSAFRRLIKELNPGAVGLVVTEFISVEGLTRKGPRSVAMMRHVPEERPFGIQIFGYDIDRMRDAAVMAQDAGADIVDINCGCPAPKVVKRGGGCELMRQPTHLAKILAEVRRAIQVPLTMKFRSGWDDSSRNAVEIAKLAESEGVEAVAVHGRTRAQLYRGDADWSIVREVAQAVKIPVLGSGDVVDCASAAERHAYGVAGLLIGRAALYNPFIFSEICGAAPRKLGKDPELVLSILERYVELLREEFSDTRCIGRVKQLVSQMCRGYSWRRDLCRAATFDEQRRILTELKSSPGYVYESHEANTPEEPIVACQL